MLGVFCGSRLAGPCLSFLPPQRSHWFVPGQNGHFIAGIQCFDDLSQMQTGIFNRYGSRHRDSRSELRTEHRKLRLHRSTAPRIVFGDRPIRIMIGQSATDEIQRPPFPSVLLPLIRSFHPQFVYRTFSQILGHSRLTLPDLSAADHHTPRRFRAFFGVRGPIP